jgi:hypothetical protein
VSVGSIGASHSLSSQLTQRATQSATAALQGQIRSAREQLNDWVTCVSATTPKGQAEIQSLSAQIAAAQDHIHQLQQHASGSGALLDVWA